MPDLSQHARQLRTLADALDAQSDLIDAPLAPHPDTLEIINGRHTSRGQINYAVPDALQLQRRIRRYHADHDVQHGDIAAIALDAFLRAKGYPPDLKSPNSETP
ncbi:hypothetical protein SAMN05216489_08344 [Streptomyces sp. 3213]|uniref:hypothetical protein n=1 Tax=Streptomyces sp. 3213.3 TaxID=1855348 RepID=UPI000896806E|nr:hypothetical protein [Streptomyces sp. 3213.3]SEE79932.1 hypothetical protein SAMN05216489_08344 [Streptomyces sp. 3213] [Streptomyces sp. 3213.3]